MKNSDNFDLVIGEFDTQRAFQNYLGRRRPTRNAILEAIRETVHNAGDAKATRIDIIVQGQNVLVLDDGQGFGPEQRRGFFDLHRSHKTGQAGQTGQHGTGRTKAMTFSTALTVYSVSADRPEGISSSLSQDDLRTLFEKHTLEKKWSRGGMKPSWWHRGAGQTGSGIQLTLDPEFARLFPKPAVLIAELGNFLKPSLAEKVRVNGKLLANRMIVGQPIRRVFTVEEMDTEMAEQLGQIEVELFIPERRGFDEDVRLGGDHQVCTIADFVKLVDDQDLTGPIPDLLTRKVLVGDIFFGALNRHVAEDRKSFRDTLVTQNVHLHIIRFLAGVLGPIIDEVYAKHESDQVRQIRKELLRDFVDVMNTAVGFDPSEADITLDEGGGKKKKKLPGEKVKVDRELPPLILNRRRLELCPGDTKKLSVVHPRDASETQHVEWVQQAGGKETLVGRGSTFVYVAEKLGKHTIIARNSRDTSISVTVEINVIAAKKLTITPANAEVDRGGSEEFQVHSYSGAGRLTWEIVTPSGQRANGMRLVSREGTSVTLEVTERATPGEYLLKVKDVDVPTLNAETSVTVRQLLPPNLMCLDGKYYEVNAASSLQPESVRLTQDDVFHGSERVGTVTVNFDHADFRHGAELGTSAKLSHLLLMEAVIVAHVAAELGSERISTPDEALARVNSLRSQVLAAIASA